MAASGQIRLPKQWPRHVKSGILHAISLASVVLSYARGRATKRSRLRAELEQAIGEIALLREELNIKDGRWQRARSRRRPHYTPVQRMRILQLRAARGWTLEKTSRVFLVDMQTLQIWMRRLDVQRPDGKHVQVKYLANSHGKHWINEHEVLFPKEADQYAVVVFRDLDLESVVVFNRRQVDSLREKLGCSSKHAALGFHLTKRRYELIVESPIDFQSQGVELHWFGR